MSFQSRSGDRTFRHDQGIKKDSMKTWKQLEAIAKRQGMSLDIQSTSVAIDGNKGANELFAVYCDRVSKKDRIFRLCVETALKELGEP